MAALVASPLTLNTAAAAKVATSKTRWKVRASEGYDALAFLGPLSGTALYQTYYGDDAAAFGSRLPDATRSEITRLWNDARDQGFGLFAPKLSNLVSGAGGDASLDTLLAVLRAREQRIRPSYQASQYWDEKEWQWFDGAAPRIIAVITALRDAGFAAFRREHAGRELESRIAPLQEFLGGYDVVKWQEKLTGRTFDPTIEIVLLQFSKPHGVKMQGQTFLQSADYDVALTVRIAAHEMLHPPVDMKGAAAKAALATLERDTLLTKIVREHDPGFGYTTLEGLFDEDLTEALDQLICEALGVARNPADRWHKSDDGMHVLAAGLYGLLRQDRWVDTGGSIEDWLANTVRNGRLSPAVLHPVAARVLDRPVDKLWPLVSAS